MFPQLGPSVVVHKLSDDQVIILLRAAQRDLDYDTETVRASVALRTARIALSAICDELVQAIEKGRRPRS